MKKYKEALEACKINYEKAPRDWATNFGLAKTYAAMGDKPTALKYADVSAQLAPNQGTKEYVQRVKQQIVDGKDVSGFY